MPNTDDNLLKKLAEECETRIREFENAKVRCGLIGPSGSGKSSLINAISGERIAAVGVVETTTDPQDFTHKGITFTDLPGCGTISWQKDQYSEKLDLLSYDCFILITAHRFTENDVFLFRELSAKGKPCFIVRNMFDRAVEDGLYDNGHSEQQTRQLIIDDIRKNLEPSCPEKVYLTSARHPTKYDLEELLGDITKNLKGIKSNRFVADMAAYGEETLRKKREVASEILPLYAGLAAANGLNPIPGLDISADIGILMKLGGEIAHIYGLTSNQLEYVKRLLGPKALPALLAKAAQFAAKYLAKQGIITLLKQIATRTTAKQASKWIPFVGPLIAAGIGWKATFILGEQLIEEAEQLAREILDELIRETSSSNEGNSAEANA